MVWGASSFSRASQPPAGSDVTHVGGGGQHLNGLVLLILGEHRDPLDRRRSSSATATCTRLLSLLEARVGFLTQERNARASLLTRELLAGESPIVLGP